jgi:hypothetical protein
MPEFRTARLAGIAILTACLVGASRPAALDAQIRHDLDGFGSCARCELVVSRDLALRPRPPAAIETEHAWARFNRQEQRYYLVAGPTTIAIFDRDGRYLESFGRRGRGPGELEFIRDIHFRDGNAIVLDAGQSRWMVRTERGEERSLGRILRGALGFVVVAPDTAIVAAVATTSARAGLPLHLIAMRTGEEVRHFGSESGDFNAALPWSQRVLLAPGSTSRSAWVASPRELRFEEWSAEGSLLRVVRGAPDWFPPVVRLPAFGTAPPPTRMRQFLVDSEQRLWVLSWVAARDWQRAVRTARRTPAGENLIDTEDYFATRLDVWGFRDQTYYGSIRWEDDNVLLLERNGQILIQRLEYGDDLEPFIALFRVEIDARR